MGGGFGDFSGYGGGFGQGYGRSFSEDGQGGGGGSFVDSKPVMMTMRGMPWSTKLSDISQFFSGVADVVDAEIEYGHDGRPSGSAKVLFGSMSDAKAAMKKNKENMGSRYVELFIEGPM